VPKVVQPDPVGYASVSVPRDTMKFSTFTLNTLP